jgi:hypothetical protein
MYCGEKVYVECEVSRDSITRMKVVEQNINPDRTILIDLKQDSSDRKNIYTMLTVKNPFDKELTYEAIMLTPNDDNWRSTSIIPILPNLQNFETWPHAIISLALMGWKIK